MNKSDLTFIHVTSQSAKELPGILRITHPIKVTKDHFASYELEQRESIYSVGNIASFMNSNQIMSAQVYYTASYKEADSICKSILQK